MLNAQGSTTIRPGDEILGGVPRWAAAKLLQA
jgi:ParB-like chromosome segregation protein Spo0J